MPESVIEGLHRVSVAMINAGGDTTAVNNLIRRELSVVLDRWVPSHGQAIVSIMQNALWCLNDYLEVSAMPESEDAISSRFVQREQVPSIPDSAVVNCGIFPSQHSKNLSGSTTRYIGDLSPLNLTSIKERLQAAALLNAQSEFIGGPVKVDGKVSDVLANKLEIALGDIMAQEQRNTLLNHIAVIQSHGIDNVLLTDRVIETNFLREAGRSRRHFALPLSPQHLIAILCKAQILDSAGHVIERDITCSALRDLIRRNSLMTSDLAEHAIVTIRKTLRSLPKIDVQILLNVFPTTTDKKQ